MRRAWSDRQSDAGDDTGSAADAIAGLDERLGVAGQENVGAGAEFDQADALAALEVIAKLGEDDAARQQAGDLDEGNLVAFERRPRRGSARCVRRRGVEALRYSPLR